MRARPPEARVTEILQFKPKCKNHSLLVFFSQHSQLEQVADMADGVRG